MTSGPGEDAGKYGLVFSGIQPTGVFLRLPSGVYMFLCATRRQYTHPVSLRPCKARMVELNQLTAIVTPAKLAGIPTIGNYIGALQNWVELQNHCDKVRTKLTSS